jgi:cytochrome c-type biogenesis protein CcmH
MIWIAGVCLVIGILLIVLTPLAGLFAGGAPSATKALQEQKLRLADELAALSRKRDAGEITAEDFAAQQRVLETEAVALIEAEKQAALAQARQSSEPGKVRMLTGALALILTANVAAGVYLYQGGWRQLVVAPELAEPAAQGGPAAGGVDPNQMVARLEERLKENPDDPTGQAMLGRSYLVLERFEESAAAYARAAELDPNEPSYQVGRGVATIRLGQVEEASKIFAAVLKKDPDNMDALWFKGMLQVHQRDVEGAKKTWKHLLEVTPADQKAEMQQQIERMSEMLAQPTPAE